MHCLTTPHRGQEPRLRRKVKWQQWGLNNEGRRIRPYLNAINYINIAIAYFSGG
jgi:hypothetical protein